MKIKLNCVAMKHQGADRIRAKIANLTIADELKFWQERHVALQQQKEEMTKKHKLLERNERFS
jgi:hypothetical protein